jgi:spore germination cell wall hydrolase CwlJ-like protein
MPHPKFGLGRLAATVTSLALAACTPEHVSRSATHLTAAASARLGLAPSVAAVRTPTPAAPAELNAQRPFASLPIEPMRPFVLRTDAADRARAVRCLAQAVYYEAAREPLEGQQAVAQVVLNRVRHPAYPKSVCAVVYQGSAKATGCQFTFTCDGALRSRPEPALWTKAEGVARSALAGYVDRDVGSATHYHAVYVAPYWAPTLVKMTQVGQHIFYRWTGVWGEPAAFTGRYAGREADLSRTVLASGDAQPPSGRPDALRDVTLGAGAAARSYKVAEAAQPGAAQARVVGVLTPSRPRATPEEIQRINADLEALEKRLDAKAAAPGASSEPPPEQLRPGA